ncbi:MAG: hypothetical protein KF819_08505 [Labilithrix sp.]|nr:hypothetical protein [Labilithrix sp.]
MKSGLVALGWLATHAAACGGADAIEPPSTSPAATPSITARGFDVDGCVAKATFDIAPLDEIRFVAVDRSDFVELHAELSMIDERGLERPLGAVLADADDAVQAVLDLRTRHSNAAERSRLDARSDGPAPSQVEPPAKESRALAVHVDDLRARRIILDVSMVADEPQEIIRLFVGSDRVRSLDDFPILFPRCRASVPDAFRTSAGANGPPSHARGS